MYSLIERQNNMDNSWQIVVNILFGCLTFFAGWLLKIIFSSIQRIEADSKAFQSKYRDENLNLGEKVQNLAVLLPTEYMGKNDFNQFASLINGRFDRLEEKIDNLTKTNK